MRYLLSDAEMKPLSPGHRLLLQDENKTSGDLLPLPDVPKGPLRRVLRANSDYVGGQCVLKILSWFHHAVHTYPTTPFVAYGDDDTFWALQRIDGTFSLMQTAFATRGRDARRLRLYAGAMQYHSWWDFQEMTSVGWHFTLPAAAREYDHVVSSLATAGLPTDGTSRLPNDTTPEMAAAARRFFRPYPMAHGLGVVVSRALAQQLPASSSVSDFFTLYKAWLRSEKKSADELAKAKRAFKCRLGTDSTVGAWIAALADESNAEPLIGVDMLNFNMNWPWPLANRCYGPDAAAELNDLHAFHLYGAVAADPTVWKHLLNISHVHELAVAANRAPATTLSFALGSGELPTRLYCRHSHDSNTSASLLREWVAAGVARNATERVDGTTRGRRGGWLAGLETRRPRHLPRVDPSEWLYCGVQCLEGRKEACQRAWPDLRR